MKTLENQEVCYFCLKYIYWLKFLGTNYIYWKHGHVEKQKFVKKNNPKATF